MNISDRKVLSAVGLTKITGVAQALDGEKDYRLTPSPPSISVYSPARANFAVYARQLLALTGITDEAVLDKIRDAASRIATPEDEPWTQFDAQQILAAAGAPPAPSHVLVSRVPGSGMILFRAAGPGVPKAKALTYAARSLRPAVSILPQLRAEGIVIPDKTCLEIPVKLVETDAGLALAALLLRKRERATAEVKGTEDTGDSSTEADK